MKHIAIIANKSAGNGSVTALINQAKRSLWGWRLECMLPESADELEQACKALNPQTHEAAIVLGGDGTQNIALRALAKNKVPLLPLPGGTANDLAREMGIRYGDWEQVQHLLDHRLTENIDLIEVNGIPFATVAGIGIGAMLTNEFNQRRAQSSLFRGVSTYLKSQIYTLLSAKTILFQRSYLHNIHVKSDVFDETIRTGAMFICNQDYLGGNLRVSSLSENDDQKFRVLIIPRTFSNELIMALLQMKLGNIPSDFILFSTDHLKITNTKDKPLQLFGDGEMLAESPELKFRIIPKGLTIYRDRSRGYVA